MELKVKLDTQELFDWVYATIQQITEENKEEIDLEEVVENHLYSIMQRYVTSDRKAIANCPTLEMFEKCVQKTINTIVAPA